MLLRPTDVGSRIEGYVVEVVTVVDGIFAVATGFAVVAVELYDKGVDALVDVDVGDVVLLELVPPPVADTAF